MENQGYRERVAQAYERMAEKNVSRPIFHLTPLAGTLADPNGLFQLGDTYHVMHINNPLACEVEGRTSSVWAHWTTRDFVCWHHEPIAIWPDHPRDVNGVYSGSALTRDGKAYLYYTGNVRHEGDYDYVNSGREQNVMRVESVDEDLVEFGKKTLLMTNEDFPANMTQHVRDPQIIERGGHVYMLLGARTKDDVGCVLVYGGDDLEHFTLANVLKTPEKFGYMWECPDYVALGGRAFLLACPQGIAHEAFRYQNSHQCGYFPIDGDFASAAKVDSFQQWDYGFDLYAARTLKGSDRTVLIGWMGMAETDYGATPSREDGWDQVIAMPRELSWRGGRIYQRPVREIERLRGARTSFERTGSFSSRHFELDLMAPSGLSVTHAKIGLREDCELVYDGMSGELILRMGPICGAGRDERRMLLPTLSDLQVFVDDTTLEVFVNGGWATMTSRIFGESDECRVEIAEGSGAFWEMRGFEIK